MIWQFVLWYLHTNIAPRVTTADVNRVLVVKLSCTSNSCPGAGTAIVNCPRPCTKMGTMRLMPGSPDSAQANLKHWQSAFTVKAVKVSCWQNMSNVVFIVMSWSKPSRYLEILRTCEKPSVFVQRPWVKPHSATAGGAEDCSCVRGGALDCGQRAQLDEPAQEGLMIRARLQPRGRTIAGPARATLSRSAAPLIGLPSTPSHATWTHARSSTKPCERAGRCARRP